MSLNWKELDLILKELDLENSFIQNIRQPDFKSLVLDIYKPGSRFALMINLTQGRVRLHRLSKPVKNMKKLQRFAQMLRSRIKGGRIREAFQIESERIIRITVTRDDGDTVLYLRLWGGNSNIIAVDSENTIIDAFYRHPGRNEISGKEYFPEKSLKPDTSGKKDYSIRNYNKNESFNSSIEDYYYKIDLKEKTDTLRAKISRILTARETHLESAMSILEEKLEESSVYEMLKVHAEIIKANIYRMEPGQKILSAENFYDGNSPIDIRLDPEKTPMENAEQLFRRYKKSKAEEENILSELANIRRNLEQIKKLKIDLLEETDPESDFGRLKDFEASIPKQGSIDRKDKPPGLQFISGGFTILAGRTSAENDTLLRRHVRGNDYWMHARDYPGGFIFIKAQRGKSIPLETLLDAGNLAVFFSKARSGGQADLYYTQVKHLRRAKTGKQGLVLPTHEKNLNITLDRRRISRLFGEDED